MRPNAMRSINDGSFHRRARGMGLPEVLVSLAISAMVLTSVAVAFVAAGRRSRSTNSSFAPARRPAFRSTRS